MTPAHQRKCPGARGTDVVSLPPSKSQIQARVVIVKVCMCEVLARKKKKRSGEIKIKRSPPLSLAVLICSLLLTMTLAHKTSFPMMLIKLIIRFRISTLLPLLQSTYLMFKKYLQKKKKKEINI